MAKDNPRGEARKKAGFATQQELADWLECSRSKIGNFEALGSAHRPPPPWYDKVIDVLIENRALKAAKKRKRKK